MPVVKSCFTDAIDKGFPGQIMEGFVLSIKHSRVPITTKFIYSLYFVCKEWQILIIMFAEVKGINFTADEQVVAAKILVFWNKIQFEHIFIFGEFFFKKKAVIE